MKRREFLTASAGAAAGATAATGAASAAESSPTSTPTGDGTSTPAGNGTSTPGTATGTGTSSGPQAPDFGGYTEGAAGGAYEDLRGNSEVTVEVGAGSSGFAFAPTEIWIDPGTTVNFEWTSDNHNVKPESQPEGAGWEGTPGEELNTFDSGHAYSFTFETGGIYTYYCAPHEGQGMLGGVAVGDDVPTRTVESTPTPAAGGGGEADPEHMGVPFQAHFVGVATVLGLGIALVFTFFFLKYGTSAHTGYPEER